MHGTLNNGKHQNKPPTNTAMKTPNTTDSFLLKLDSLKFIDDESTGYHTSDPTSDRQFDGNFQNADHHSNSFAPQQQEDLNREMGPVEGVEDTRSGIWKYL